MNYLFIIIILLFISCSCEEKKNPVDEIQTKDSIGNINSISKDTINIDINKCNKNKEKKREKKKIQKKKDNKMKEEKIDSIELDSSIIETDFVQIDSIINRITHILTINKDKSIEECLELGKKELLIYSLVDSAWIEEKTLIVKFKNGFINFWDFK